MFPNIASESQDNIEKECTEVVLNPVVADEKYKSGIVMSDNLTDFTIEIDGIVYQVPMAYFELLKAGWRMKESEHYSESDLLEPGRHAYCTMEKGTKNFDIEFINMSGNIKSLNECTVGTIELYARYNDTRVSAKLVY